MNKIDELWEKYKCDVYEDGNFNPPVHMIDKGNFYNMIAEYEQSQKFTEKKCHWCNNEHTDRGKMINIDIHEYCLEGIKNGDGII